MYTLLSGVGQVGLIYHHLPSPVAAQVYRAQWLYTGPVGDDVGRSIAACDPEGPLVLFVSKMVCAFALAKIPAEYSLPSAYP